MKKNLKRETAEQYDLWTLIAQLALLACLMVYVIVKLFDYVEVSVHNERTVYLKAQTETSAGLINNILSQYTEYADVCARTISNEPGSGCDMEEFLQNVGEKLFLDDVRLILIDDNTIWYAENEASGKITAPEYYGDKTDDSLIYITTGVDVTVESLVFRQRLEKPVLLKVGGREVRISYCAVIYYMDQLQEDLEFAFPYQCNSFILDSNGLMLYRNFQLGRLVDGTNVFSKYRRVEFLHGDTAEGLLKELADGDVSVGEFEVSDGSYFICTAPLQTNGWFVSFVLSSGDLTSGNYIRTMFIYVLVIGVIFVAALFLAGSISIKRKQERKLLETERVSNLRLEEASRAKTDFLSNMTHDIRTPINGIMGMTMLASKEENPPKTVECLKKIDLSSRYLLSLVNDVLDMSAIESGKLNITAEPMNLISFMDSCVSIVNGQMQGRALTVETEYSGLKHPNVLGDELHLRQIFINILSNAVKFTPDGGHIRFRGQETEGKPESGIAETKEGRIRVLFEIRDTGIGMSREFLEKIWDRFAQSEGGARTKYKGSGLGMAITKQLVDAMNGQITVESKEGEGSTFYVELCFERAAEEKVGTAEEEEEEEEGSRELEGLRILLAEDNAINQEIARELLEEAGAEVQIADNGRQAVEKFEASGPYSIDLILMDLMMPEMNGLEATKTIRGLEREDAGSVPIVAMTANTMENDRKATGEAGMNAHLSKPIQLRTMKKTILTCVRRNV